VTRARVGTALLALAVALALLWRARVAQPEREPLVATSLEARATDTTSTSTALEELASPPLHRDELALEPSVASAPAKPLTLHGILEDAGMLLPEVALAFQFHGGWRRSDLRELRRAVIESGLRCAQAIDWMRATEATDVARITAAAMTIWARDWSAETETALLDEAHRSGVLMPVAVFAIDRRSSGEDRAGRSARIAKLVSNALWKAGPSKPGSTMASVEVAAALHMLADSGGASGTLVALQLVRGEAHMHITTDAWSILASSGDAQLSASVVESALARVPIAQGGLNAIEGDAHDDTLLEWATRERTDSYEFHVREQARKALVFSGSERGLRATSERLDALSANDRRAELSGLANGISADDALDALRLAHALTDREAAKRFLREAGVEILALHWDPKLDETRAAALDFIQSASGWSDDERAAIRRSLRFDGAR